MNDPLVVIKIDGIVATINVLFWVSVVKNICICYITCLILIKISKKYSSIEEELLKSYNRVYFAARHVPFTKFMSIGHDFSHVIHSRSNHFKNNTLD